MSSRSRIRPFLASLTALATAGTALGLTATSAGAADSDAATTVQVSVRTGGFVPGWGANDTTAVLSHDGRYAVLSGSGPMVPGQPQIQFQVVRRDRHLGTTELISRSSTGEMANAHSYDPSVSADGNVIAFRSAASNLVEGDTNGEDDIFVHDVRTGETIRATATATGEQVDGDTYAGPPSISADGKWVAFSAQPQGYAPGDSDHIQTYVRNLETGEVEVASIPSPPLNFNGSHVDTRIGVSNGGERVVFISLVNNHAIQVLLRDRTDNTTTAIGGEQWSEMRASISPDGRWVVYDSDNEDQVPGDTNDKHDVFVYDVNTGTKERVSVASDGTEGNGGSSHGSISADGRYVSFRSDATNLVPGDTNGETDIFRHDRQTGETVRVNVHDTTGAQTTASTTGARISGNGQHVAFASHNRLSKAGTANYAQSYVRDFTGAYPALFAAIPRLPGRVAAGSTTSIPTRDIRAGQSLEVTWTPIGGTKGKPVVQQVSVAGNSFDLNALPRSRAGRYEVTVTYEGSQVVRGTVDVLRPSVTGVPKQAKKGKQVKVRTAGLAQGSKVQVRFVPRGATKGKAVNRSGKVNKNGVVKVKAAPRKGTFRIVVRSGGKVIGKGPIRLR